MGGHEGGEHPGHEQTGDADGQDFAEHFGHGVVGVEFGVAK